MLYIKIYFKKKNNIAMSYIIFFETYYFLGDDNMYVKIPFESIIDFKTNISEITKMSLEHDFNVNDGLVLGNFYVSGEYRSHEVSVNTEPFKHTLPFTVELREDINKDTLEFNIEDFSYEIVESKKLKVNIVYSLKAELEELFERVNEDELNSELEYIDEFLNQEKIKEESEDEENDEYERDMEEVKNEIPKEDEKLEEEIKEEVKEEVKEEKVDEKKEEQEERISINEEKTIMETIKDSDDTFVTYHVHIVKESESLESIASFYNVPVSIINEYNNFDSVSIGDKVLIPKIDE